LETIQDLQQDVKKVQKVQQQKVKLTNERIVKWQEMLEGWPQKKAPKMKPRGRKGIPDPIRGYVWQILLESGDVFQGQDRSKVYKEMLNKEGSKKMKETIFKDVTRTFPKHIFFKDKFGAGQKTLYNVCKAVANCQEETGYVQGMGYIIAVLLTYMDQEDAFTSCITLMRNFNMAGFYKPGMPGLQKAFYVLLSLIKKFLPDLHTHFSANNMLPSMYASQWFMTIYAVNIPFECTIRIWDIFFIEKQKILYRVALAFLKMAQKELLKSEIEGLFTNLRNL